MPRGAYPRTVRPVEDRFWAKVEKTNGCWWWTAGKTRKGYGSFGMGRRSDGKREAHRVAWELTSGPVPVGMCVLHHCDEPGCVNPAHLFLGTRADNMRDAAAKGRLGQQRNPALFQGERSGRAQLTEEIVSAIREDWSNGMTSTALARKYGIARTTAWQVAKGQRWAHSHVSNT
jgi:hypothetical protein